MFALGQADKDYPRSIPSLVFEMPHFREYRSQALLIRRGDYFFVAHGIARLNDEFDSAR